MQLLYASYGALVSFTAGHLLLAQGQPLQATITMISGSILALIALVGALRSWHRRWAAKRILRYTGTRRANSFAVEHLSTALGIPIFSVEAGIDYLSDKGRAERFGGVWMIK